MPVHQILDTGPKYTHVANSGAVLDFPEKSAFSLVRPGGATYGMYLEDELPRTVPLLETMTMKRSVRG
jgi:alanine racemase